MQNSIFSLAYLILLLTLVLVSCDSKIANDRFTLLDNEEIGIDFINAVNSDTLDITDYVNMYHGGGVAIADFNNDGAQDVFMVGNAVSCELYINKNNSTIAFSNVSESAGIHTTTWVNGVAVGDVNSDGRLDIYLSCSAGKEADDRRNMLYINQGNDNDGYPTFIEKASDYGVDDESHTMQSAFLDYDRDGDLDLFSIVNYPTGYLDAEANRIVTLKAIGDSNKSDRLYRNDGADDNGDIIFTNVSKDAGITYEGYSLGLSISDINKDGWPDIYVSNDYVTNDILYLNNGDGTFTNDVWSLFKHTSYSSMGVDIADMNNDGLNEVAVVDMLPMKDENMKMMYSSSNNINFEFMKKSSYVDQYFRNTLQFNNGFNEDGVPLYSEIGQLAGIHKTNWSWSVLMTDLDLDGRRDIMITNGFSKDVNDLDFINYQPQNSFAAKAFDEEAYEKSLKSQKGIYLPNYIFKNQGTLEFQDVSAEWGFKQASFSNGASVGDLDNDGDLDIVINNINDLAFIYENTTNTRESTEANYLKIKLESEDGGFVGVGAQVEVTTSSLSLTAENNLTRGYLSSVSPDLIFGLGKDTVAEAINVLWADGSIQTLSKIAGNQTLVISKDSSTPVDQPIKREYGRDYSFERNQIIGLKHKSKENTFNDFNQQVLIPKKYSQNGPSISVADVNGDELDDIFISGPIGQAGSLFLQSNGGDFTQTQISDNREYEELGSLFIDIDNDGDEDLYIVSGGVEYGKSHRYYTDRLFINDGDGRYAESTIPLPSTAGTCVTACDYDKDGDMDLFIGGGVKPGQYPLSEKSYLLRNDSKAGSGLVLTDISELVFGDEAALGIVNSALWTDYDNDGWRDLIVVGEFMPIMIYKNSGGGLEKEENEYFEDYKGMWNSISGVDLDNDGDTDYILGNLGLNNRYSSYPNIDLKVYVSDFDDNGMVDPIMTRKEDGKEVPLHLRDDLYKQLNFLKKKLPKYSDYSKASIQEIIDAESLSEARVFHCNYLKSAILHNDSAEGFRFLELPHEAQFSPMYGLQVDDLNGDGEKDIFTVGNSFAFGGFTGWQDASYGLIIKTDTDLEVNAVSPSLTNFKNDGDGKAMSRLVLSDNRTAYIVANNNDSISVHTTVNRGDEWIKLRQDDAYLDITYDDGKREKVELYHGSGYLSQFSRKLRVPAKATSIRVVSINNEGRMVSEKLLY